MKRGKVKVARRKKAYYEGRSFNPLMKRGKVKEGGFQGQLSPLFIIGFPPHGVKNLVSKNKKYFFTV